MIKKQIDSKLPLSLESLEHSCLASSNCSVVSSNCICCCCNLLLYALTCSKNKNQICNVLSLNNEIIINMTVNVEIYIYIYVWKLNPTVLELDIWADKFCSSLDAICTHTIDTLRHQSLSLMSSALCHIHYIYIYIYIYKYFLLLNFRFCDWILELSYLFYFHLIFSSEIIGFLFS